MQTVADQIIDALGGSTAVSRLIDTPLSTVHSWRKKGISKSRMSHLRLAARADGREHLIAAIIGDADHAASDTTDVAPPSAGNDGASSPQVAHA